MRFLLKVNIPVGPGNDAARAGKLGARIKAILEEQKPEAAYFTDNNGERCGMLFLDIKDASEIPKICEPWFLSFDALVALHPVMVVDDLVKAGPAIEHAVKKYG